MRKLNIGWMLLAVASSAAAFDPGSPSCADLGGRPLSTQGRNLRASFARQMALRDRGMVVTPELIQQLRSIPVTEPGAKIAAVVPDGVLQPQAPGEAPALAQGGGSNAGAPQAAGDIMVYNPTDFFGGSTRFRSNPNGPNDYYGLRFTTSQVAKQLPFQVDSIWAFMDDFFFWSKNWQISVVTEDPANPFLPLRSAVVSGPITFDVSAPPYSFAKSTTPSRIVNAKIELPDADYPASARFSINDRSMDDTFDRPNEPLSANGNWVECSSTACFTGSSLQIVSNRLTAPTPGTVFAWRGADPSAGDCDSGTGVAPCVRYIVDYIDNAQLQIYHPDMDARYTIDFDLSAPGARAAGIFTRTTLDYAVNPPAPGTFYAAFVDKPSGRLIITDETFTNILASTPLSATTGTLAVEVSGYNPVVIRATVGATSTIATDSTLLYHGDISYGNIGGIVFPSAGGGETADNMRTDRNADLFVVMKMPAGEAVRLWSDARPESRDFFNTFSTIDGAAWDQAGIASDVDCAKSRNTIVALQTKDGAAGGGNSMFQANSTVISLFLPCCGCPEKPYTCVPYPFSDECDPSPGNWSADTQPDYQIGVPIDIDPKFLNDHAPNTVGRVLFYWLVCNDADLTCSFATCDPGPSPTQNCGAYAFALGPDLAGAGQIPGLTTTTSQDIPGWDGDSFVDGTLFLQAATPSTFTPQSSGNYHVYMLELFDYSNPPDGPDDPNPDEYLSNRYVSRPFTVGGCVAPKPYNFAANSLLMSKTGSGCSTSQIYSEWRQATTPVDPTLPFNIHEISTHALLQSSLAGCLATECNPWPTAPTWSAVVNSTFCIDPATITGDVNYYEVYQADDCDGSSRADQ